MKRRTFFIASAVILLSLVAAGCTRTTMGRMFDYNGRTVQQFSGGVLIGTYQVQGTVYS